MTSRASAAQQGQAEPGTAADGGGVGVFAAVTGVSASTAAELSHSAVMTQCKNAVGIDTRPVGCDTRWVASNSRTRNQALQPMAGA